MSSEIFLNGVLVAGPSNFNQNVNVLSIPVTVQAQNTLTVELRGKPGGQVTLRIERDANQIPQADAGFDQTVFVGDTVSLDGSGSTDVDGDPLSYLWQLVVTPSGSQAILSGTTTINPTFNIDLPCSYEAELIVNDGFEDSLPDRVMIDTQNSAPVADAGADQTAFVNDVVSFDGQGSTDIDNDPLTYHWNLLSAPAGSQSTLQTPNSVITDLLIDLPGHYIAELIVNDGTINSAPDQVEIDTVNSVPVAVPGNDQTGFVGQQVNLDGSGSFDVDNDTLTYSWSMLSQPSNGSAQLVDANTDQSYFTPDIEGDYIVQLIVGDSQSTSIPVTLTVTVQLPNLNPVIISSPPLVATTGQLYTYSISANDPDADPLSYQLTSAPSGMNIDTNGNISWTPSTTGTYAVILVVSDNRDGQAQQSFSIVVSNAGLPPDPTTTAPVLNPTELTPFYERTEFLYTGNNPVQTGVNPGTIDPERAAVVRGIVEDDNNQPLSGVIISIKDHPEYGHTQSRTDGVFDMAVNGGGELIIS